MMQFQVVVNTEDPEPEFEEQHPEHWSEAFLELNQAHELAFGVSWLITLAIYAYGKRWRRYYGYRLTSTAFLITVLPDFRTTSYYPW